VQLGSGNGSSYPTRIDNRQVYVNSPLAAPDSETRIDSELANDALAAIEAVERALGARVNGNYGSLAARLNQFIPGGGTPTTVETFAASTQWVLPGAVHRLGSPAFLVYAYDNADPAAALDPGAIHVDPTSYDITVTFGTPQAGLLVATLGQPAYTTTFALTEAPYTLTVLGAVHQCGTDNLLWQVRDMQGDVLVPGSVSVHPTTYDVTVMFAQPQSGRLVLGVPGQVTTTDFVSDVVVTVPAVSHGLTTRAIAWQLWDAAVPATNSVAPQQLTVDPVTFEVVATFGQAQSGRLVLGSALGVSGSDFTLRDAGVPDQTAVQVYSQGGTLYLQQGSGDSAVVQNKTGATLATVNATGQLGLGTTPTHQLHLSTDDAAKLATATWATTSDARLKDVLGPYTDGLALLAALEPVWYRYNGLGGIRRDSREYVGLLAQAVEQVAPYMVTARRGRLRAEDEDTDLLELNTSPLMFALINAVNTLAADLAAVQAEVAQLRAQHTPPAEETP
jgi:Chaperone of endosialidase